MNVRTKDMVPGRIYKFIEGNAFLFLRFTRTFVQGGQPAHIYQILNKTRMIETADWDVEEVEEI